MPFYIAISGAGGIGKSTALAWLTEHLTPFLPLVTLGDIALSDLTRPIEDITNRLAQEKLEENRLIRDYLEKGVSVLADRSCLDPLALAMTLLPAARWRLLEKWYGSHDFVYGHHVILGAPHRVIRDRRLRRGSSPRSTWLRSFEISQEEYDTLWVKHWRAIHTSRGIPMIDVNFAADEICTNLASLMAALTSRIKGLPMPPFARYSHVKRSSYSDHE